MSDVTAILAAIEHGDREAAAELLPLIYDELRKLAAQKLAVSRRDRRFRPPRDSFTRPTSGWSATVPQKPWDGRGHFFAAAADGHAAHS